MHVGTFLLKPHLTNLRVEKIIWRFKENITVALIISDFYDCFISSAVKVLFIPVLFKETLEESEEKHSPPIYSR